jgi:hypothetical protein
VSRSGISRSNLAWPDALESFYIARSVDVAAAGLRDPAALRRVAGGKDPANGSLGWTNGAMGAVKFFRHR